MEVNEKGVEVFRGFTIKWEWVDGMICGMIEKGDAELITDPAVVALDVKLQEFVDNTKVKFDNVGKLKLEKALTMSMVKRFMPELLE